jgi:hypothetical protein
MANRDILVTEAERERVLWAVIRQALLLAVDGIERWLGISPRTSEIRKNGRQDERTG